MQTSARLVPAVTERPVVRATRWTGHHLRPPPVSRGLLARPRVQGALDEEAQAAVVCLQAPGGYGKTTALAQWAARQSRPVLWLGVRPAAADPHWLAQTLLEALGDAGLAARSVSLPGHLDAVSWHLHTLPIVEDVLSSVAEPFVVVIDDASAMSGSSWECLAESIATSLPEGSTLAMSTRDAVPATLWRLHTRGLVHVLGPDVLAFDEEEAGALMDLLDVPMPPSHLERVVHETEGWPVALYLVGLSSRSQLSTGPTSVAGIAGLDEYLSADIVGRLSPEDAAFLERVSVLSVLDEDGCNALTGAGDSLARLRRLASVNHLLAPQDAPANRFRMHPLLARFLGEDLRERDPEAWRAAHESASLMDEERGDIDGAVHHAKLARDDDRLGALVWSHTAEQLGYGRWAVVQRWLGGLDEGRVHQSCGLALSAAWVAIQSGDMTTANRLVLQASLRADGGRPSCRPDLDLIEATIGTGGLDQIESSARSFLESTPVDDRWQTLAYFLLGVSLVLRDHIDAGVEALDTGSRRADALGVPLMHALCLAGLADAALARDDQHRALSYIRELRQIASTYRLDTVATSAPLYATSTVGYVLEGRYADARRESARALRLIALMRDVAPWHAVQGRLTLAGVNLTLGDPERAKVLLSEAGDARGPATACPVLDRVYVKTEEQLSQVTVNLAGGSSLTTAEVRVLQYLPTHLSFPQIAEELVVSRHTVKTQAMSAYRKLGVHTRTQAIEQARRAGLLPPA